MWQKLDRWTEHTNQINNNNDDIICHRSTSHIRFIVNAAALLSSASWIGQTPLKVFLCFLLSFLMSSPDHARCTLPDRRAVVDQLCRGEREGSAVRTVSGLRRGQLAVVFSVNPPHQQRLICKAVAMNSVIFRWESEKKKK